MNNKKYFYIRYVVLIICFFTIGCITAPRDQGTKQVLFRLNSIKDFSVKCAKTIGGYVYHPRKNVRRIIYPRVADYYQANEYFQKEEYNLAIEKYREFIRLNPSHEFTADAQLSLGWAYYITGDNKKALEAIESVKTDDKELAKNVKELRNKCQSKYAAVVEDVFVTKADMLDFYVPEYTNVQRLKLQGNVGEAVENVAINGVKVKLISGIFFGELSLEEGENKIVLTITDAKGKIKQKRYNVVFDQVPPVIECLDVSIDDMGYMVVKGKMSEAGKITVNSEQILVSQKGDFQIKIQPVVDKQLELLAEDKAGNKTTKIFYDMKAPEKPKGLQIIDRTENFIKLGWDENDEEDLKGYNIYMIENGQERKKLNKKILKFAFYTIKNLSSESSYAVSVTAVDKMRNESMNSDWIDIFMVAEDSPAGKGLQ